VVAVRWALVFLVALSSAAVTAAPLSTNNLRPFQVNPSLRAWSETFCIANTEAMALGVPVVSFGVGGVGEYLWDPAAAEGTPGGPGATAKNGTCDERPRNGVIVVSPPAPSSPASQPPPALSSLLGDAVLALLRDGDGRRAIGAAARATVLRRFTVAHMVDAYSALYEDLAAAKHTGFI